jgi:hypothetical protein
MKKHSLKIIKIPSPKSPVYRQEFISQPINYLKIIENPDKIKVEHLTKDVDIKNDLKYLETKKLIYPNPEPYIPPPLEKSEIQIPESSRKTSLPTPKPPKPITSSVVNNISKYKFDIPPDSDDEDFELESRYTRYVNSHTEEPEILAPPKSPPSQHTPPSLQPTSQHYTPQYTPPPSHTTPQYTPPPSHTTPQYTPPPSHTTPQYTPPPLHTTPQYTPPSQQQITHQYSPQHISANEQNTHSRLHDFLKYSDSDSDNESNTSYSYRHKKSKNVVDPYKYMSKNQREFTNQHYEPPTLEQLERNGEYTSQPIFLQAQQLDELYNKQTELPTTPPQHYEQPPPLNEHYHEMQYEEEESIDDKKREILTKLDLLRKKYPNNAKTIPDLNMQTSFSEMKSIYQLELKKLEIDSNVTNYRQYLMGGFMLIEYILGRFLRIDLEGFTQQQIINMQQYEIFLIEIGEKNYVPEGKKWSVELRLFFFIFIQATMFTVSKLILQKTGNNLLGLFNDSLPQQTFKKKVKRPDIDIEDL